MENRFAAENPEFALDRVFSYERPGQLLAVSVAFMIRICASHEAARCLTAGRVKTGL